MRKISFNTTARRISLLLVAIFFLASNALTVSAQQAISPATGVIVNPARQKVKVKSKTAERIFVSDSTVEKSIVVDPKVNISLCVAEGNLKVSGWDRNEIRAFVTNGTDIGFNVRGKNKQNNAVLLKITGINEVRANFPNQRECLSAEQIELDVPRGALVNITSRTSETTVESIRKVSVENVGGDIFLNQIEQGISASTLEGDVTVENSSGAITLGSGNGNILVYDISPVEIGDIFKAKTFSGAISLQQVSHRQTDVNSNSGAVKFVGELLSGGQYNFGTQNGSLTVAIPEKSSCKISASYGLGAFNSELTLQNIVLNNASRVKSLTGVLGTGEANVNLRTYSGSIHIRKQ